MKQYIFDIAPVAKPRMTRSDKWKKRDCVLNYWNFADKLNMLFLKEKFTFPVAYFEITFYIPMPVSWPERKRKQLNNTYHKNKPDIDNLLKSFLDICFKNSKGVNDSHVCDLRISKKWALTGKIEIIEK